MIDSGSGPLTAAMHGNTKFEKKIHSCLCLYLSVCQYACLSVYVSVCLCVSMPVCLLVSLSTHLSICLCVSMPVYLRVCLTMYLTVA